VIVFDKLRQRMHDMGTIKALCEAAERHARSDGQPEPGAEHFLLAALDLPDGSARRVLSRVGVDIEGLREAIRGQHADALQAVGLDPASLDAMGQSLPPLPPARGLYAAQPSAQALMQALAELPKHGPLVGAHVLAVVSSLEYGVAPRALRALGVDSQTLAKELDS
jgi:hypothetical protein